MQVTLLLLTAWRESQASRYDRVVPKGKYLRYCSEQVCLERSENLASAIKGVTLIPTLRRDLLRDVKIPKVSGRLYVILGVKVGNGEDFFCIGCMIPLIYQLMAVKKTSFPETECSGSIVYVQYGVSMELDTAYWAFLGIGNTFDIFQNIIFHILKTAYRGRLDTAY
ncbi:hypothetical protein Tco_0655992 [Tanacetum coccineum]|uniref:Uncharacterized protein n=1 Tax=Tanacetum coccineum TaxID=301880 RepID=A0ABQ4X853_9ASTR